LVRAGLSPKNGQFTVCGSFGDGGFCGLKWRIASALWTSAGRFSSS
jgi:hypothetical protein